MPNRPRLKTFFTPPVLMLGAIALAWCWYFHFWPLLHTANEAIRLDFVQAIVDDGTFQIDQVEKRHGKPSIDRCRFGHHDYMDKAPGLSLLTVPIYAAVKAIAPNVQRFDEIWKVGQLACLFTTALPLLLALRQMFLFFRRRGVSEPDAALTLCALGLASPVFVYSTLFFGHGLATACVMLGFFQWVERDSAKSQFVAGLWLGLAGLTDTPVFVLGALICIYSALERSRHAQPPQVTAVRTLALGLPIAAGLAIFVGLQLGYNFATVGDPLRFTYHYKADPRFAAIMATGVLGFGLPTPRALFELLFGASRGLFYASPILLAGLCGHIISLINNDLAPDRRRESGFCLTAITAYTLFVAGFGDWHAGDSPGARHLLPITPLMAAGLPTLLACRLPQLLRGLVAAAIAIGVLMALATIASFPYHFEALQRPVLEFSWPLAMSGHFSPSIGRTVGLNDWLSFGLFCTFILAAFSLSLLAMKRDPNQIPPVGSRASNLAVASLITAAWVIALMATVPEPGRVVEILRFQGSTMLGPNADERADNKPWQRAVRDR